MKPMMAVALKHEDIDRKTSSSWLMEPKLDGMRLLLEMRSGILIHAWTRGGRDVLPQVPDDWKEAVSPILSSFYVHTGYNWLDCEFGYGNCFVMDFNKTMRVMGSGPAEAQRKAEELEESPTAVIFDIPDMEGALGLRRDVLRDFVEMWDTHVDRMDELTYSIGTISGPLILVPQTRGWDERRYEAIVRYGGEGAMLKNPYSLYLPGARKTDTWYKVKKFDTVDMYVTGFDPGQGKYEGLVGALVLETTDGLRLRASGMTDSERIRITARMERIIREKWVAEIKYFGLTAGTPRHPQFLRWRKDKPWTECQWVNNKGA